jgi:hypothetical protein
MSTMEDFFNLLETYTVGTAARLCEIAHIKTIKMISCIVVISPVSWKVTERMRTHAKNGLENLIWRLFDDSSSLMAERRFREYLTI